MLQSVLFEDLWSFEIAEENKYFMLIWAKKELSVKIRNHKKHLIQKKIKLPGKISPESKGWLSQVLFWHLSQNSIYSQKIYLLDL